MKKSILYPIEKGSSVVFSAVIQENKDMNSVVTELPVEIGRKISDHVQPLPVRLNFQAYLTENAGEPAPETRKEMLERYWKDGVLLRYMGRHILTFAVIESLSFPVDARVKNGFFVSVSLREVKRVAFEEIFLVGPDPNVSDSVSIIRMVVGLDPTPVGLEGLSVGDAIDVLREIVGLNNNLRPTAEQGFQSLQSNDYGQYIKVDKMRMPYTVRVKIEEPDPRNNGQMWFSWLVTLTFRYDSVTDSFYFDQHVWDTINNRQAVQTKTGVPMVYGTVVFRTAFQARSYWGWWEAASARLRFQNKHTSSTAPITFDNINETVFLYYDKNINF